MTRIDSMVVANPNRDIIEDRRKKQGYSLKEIKTVLTRMKLLIFCYEFLKGIDKPVVYFDYPRYSVAWYIVRRFQGDCMIVSDASHILIPATIPPNISTTGSIDPCLFLFRPVGAILDTTLQRFLLPRGTS